MMCALPRRRQRRKKKEKEERDRAKVFRDAGFHALMRPCEWGGEGGGGGK